MSKKIEIQLAATGGAQAAGEILKVTDAAKTVETTGTTGFGEMLDGIPKSAEEAAKGIEKVVDAVKEVEATGTTGFGEMLDGIPKSAEEAAKGIEKVVDAAKKVEATGTTAFGGMLEFGEKVRAAKEQAHKERIAQIEKEKAAIDEQARSDKKALDNELAGMREKERASRDYAATLDTEAAEKKSANRKREIGGALGAIGIAAGLAAKTIGDVTEQLNSIDTGSLKKVDTALAEQIESAKKLANALQDPIGALVALANGGTTIKEAFTGLNEQLALNTKQQTEAVDRFLAKSDIQVKAIEKQAADLKAANALLDAKDETAATVRAGKNEARVRAGEAPEDVASEEAQAKAADEFQKIEREQAAARVGFQEKFDGKDNSIASAQRKVDQAEAARDKIEASVTKSNISAAAVRNRDPKSRKESERLQNLDRDNRQEAEATKRFQGPVASALPEAQKLLKDAKKEFEDQKIEIARVDALANERKAKIRAETANEIAAQQAQKSERIAREKEKENRPAKPVSIPRPEKTEDPAETAEKRRNAEAQVGRDAEKLIPEGVSQKFRAAVEAAAVRLQNGDQGGELEKLADLLAQLGASSNAALSGLRSTVAQVEAEIATLRTQVKRK